MSHLTLPRTATLLIQDLENQVKMIEAQNPFSFFIIGLHQFYTEIEGATNFVRKALLIKHGYDLVNRFNNLTINSEASYQQANYFIHFCEKTAQLFDCAEQVKGTVFHKKIRELPGGMELDVPASILSKRNAMVAKCEEYKLGKKPVNFISNHDFGFFQTSINSSMHDLIHLDENALDISDHLKLELETFFGFEAIESDYLSERLDVF